MIKLKSFHFLVLTALASSLFIAVQSDALFHWAQLASSYGATPELAIISTDVNPDNYNPLPGETRIDVVVRNNGSRTSGATQLNLHGSTDGVCRPNVSFLTAVAVEPIAPGASVTKTIFSDPASIPYLFAFAVESDLPNQPTPFTSQTRFYLCAFLEGDGNAFAAVELQGVRSDDFTYFPWDTNRSGAVTPADVAYVLNRLGGSDTLADINADGVVTAADATLILERLGYSVNTSVNENSE